MTALRWTFTVLALVCTSAGLQAQESQSSGSAATPAYLELQGAALGAFTDVNARVARSSAQRYIESVRDSGRAVPEQATALLAAAQKALDGGDTYRAFRLCARAAAWATGKDKVEGFEVAASFQMFLNRAIFAGEETITLTVRPLFTLGHPLAQRYTVEAWLDTPAGKIAGTDQKTAATELKEYRFDYPTDALQDGIIAVGYRLTSSAGERGEADVMDLVERVRSVYSIEPSRVFLAGWSSGGGQSWRIAIHNPERFGGVAPVGNEAAWLTPENTEKARDLPVLYSIAATETENGRRTAALAKDLLRNFTYKEYPDTEHATVWYAALPVMFDFFDRQRDATTRRRFK